MGKKDQTGHDRWREGSFIGAVHRMAAALDGHYTLVCGAFSSDPIKSISSGDALNLQKDRIYQTYEEMLK